MFLVQWFCCGDVRRVYQHIPACTFLDSNLCRYSRLAPQHEQTASSKYVSFISCNCSLKYFSLGRVRGNCCGGQYRGWRSCTVAELFFSHLRHTAGAH